MKVQAENQNLMKTCFYSFIICSFIFILADATIPQNVKCPFQYLYHFGDGATDTGNSIRLLPFGPSLPAAHLPYGRMNPGHPTGRWSDGLVEFDYTDCADRLGNSLLFMGDNEANDIGYPLVQGKSIKEVTTYVPFVIRAIVKATRELIRMGTKQIIIPGSAPLGCYPYVLTALPNSDPTAYDNLGCLKSVNNLILTKNIALQAEIIKLSLEFPTTQILFADIYTSVRSIIQLASISGNFTLKACCGIGGKYNYDGKRFCGSPGVPVCADPNQYIYWDGLHYTQETYLRYLQIMVPPTLIALKCTLI